LLAEQVNSGVAGAPERYAKALENARSAIDILDFSPEFQQSKKYVQSDDINLLRILSDLTPDEERVDEDALSEVTDLISELRDYAVEWGCPVSTDSLPLGHSTSSQSNLFVL